MIHVVAVDEDLVTSKDLLTRDKVWAWMRRSGWLTGRLVAEIPDFRHLSVKIGDGCSIERWREYFLAIRKENKSIIIPNPQGGNWRERARKAEFVDRIISNSMPMDEDPKRILTFNEWLELEPIPEMVWNDDSNFLRTCGIIFFASDRIDIIDHYLPLPPLGTLPLPQIPLLRYLEEHASLYNKKRRTLIFHVPERLSQKHPSQINEHDTVSSLLARLNSPNLKDLFNITFRVWQPDKIHDRLILGDFYGLHLGDGLKAEKREIVVTHISETIALRKYFPKSGDPKLFCEIGSEI